MKELKKILGVFIFVMVLTILPNKVLAKAKYVVNDMTMNDIAIGSGESYEEPYAVFYIGQTGTFKYSLSTEELDASKTYTVSMKSDFMNVSYDYTGEELNNGVQITITDAKSFVELKIVEKGTDNEIYTTYTTSCWYDGCTPETYDVATIFMFSEDIDSTELDNFYNSTFKNGKAKVATIKLDDIYARNSALTVSLKKYETERFEIEDETYDEDDPTTLRIVDTSKKFHSKVYPITYEYATIDATKKAKVEAVIKQFDQSFNNLEEKWFDIEDLENINFKYSTRNIKSDGKVINMAANYSSKLHGLLGNNNMSVAADVRMGWESDMTAGAGGYLNILYDGVIYASVNAQGTIQKNIIYVPDGTTKNRDAYISAAKERIKKYLPYASVNITYGGQITSLTEEDLGFPVSELSEIVDVDKTLGEYYILTLDGKNFKFFIAEGSSKMNEPFLKTKDLVSSVYVEANSSQAPLDSIFNDEILDKNSEQYKNLISKLKLSDGISVDIKLFSNSQNAYVSKLSNGKFKVYIPVDSSYSNKELIAYYVNDNGDTEEYKVTIKDGYAIFETDHFSVYTLGVKETEKKEDSKTSKDINNPNTSDEGVTKYIVIGGIAIVGLVIVSIFLFKKKK